MKSAELSDSDLQFLMSRMLDAARKGGNIQKGERPSPVFMTHWRDKLSEIKPIRSEWGGFPDVISLSQHGGAKKHPGYVQAKGGDMDSALEVVDSLVTDEKIEEIVQALSGRTPAIVPVIADELSGENRLPLAYAAVLSETLGLPVDTEIVQIVRAYHTDAGAFHRIGINPIFDGEVVPDQEYMTVDDTLTMGGTVASLKGYIESNGGRVVLASTLTGHPAASNIVVKEKMIRSLKDKHGDELEQYLQEELGYGIEKLTQGEAGHIKATPSVVELRKRVAEAKRAAGLDEGSRRRTVPPPSSDSINTEEDPSDEGFSDSGAKFSRKPKKSINQTEDAQPTRSELLGNITDAIRPLPKLKQRQVLNKLSKAAQGDPDAMADLYRLDARLGGAVTDYFNSEKFSDGFNAPSAGVSDWFQFNIVDRKHPHVCGEDRLPVVQCSAIEETPPRVWG